MKWIVAANTNHCSIYTYQKNGLDLVKEMDHPENKMANRDLVTDKPGRYQSGTNQGAYTSATEPDDVNVEKFAREIATELDNAKNQNKYNELIVVMPAQMEGLVSKHLNKNVKELIALTLHKNMMHLNDNELLNYVKESMKR